MKFNVYDFITGLLNNGIKFYIPRPIQEYIEDGDVDIIIYEECINDFEEYLREKYHVYDCLESRYAFKTSEYIINNITIDVKKIICFGARKQIVCSEKPIIKSIEVINGFIYPGNTDNKQLFHIIWLLHLTLDKNKPEDSSTFELFRSYSKGRLLNFNFIYTLSFVVDSNIFKNIDDFEFDQLRTDLLKELKLKNKMLSTFLPMFYFRCYFYIRRKFLYGKK